MRNPLFDSDSPTPVVAFLSVTSKVAASASATRIFDIPFYFSSNEWHLLLEILAILSMILGNLIAITQTSMKRMLAYSSIGQIGYVIIGITEGDQSFQCFEAQYGKSTAKKIEGTDFYVTGLQGEINKFYADSGDKIQNELLAAISKAPVGESVKQQIKQSFKMVKYGVNDIIILELASNDKPITYDGEIYIREGNNTKKLENTKATIEYCKRVFGTTDMI